MIKKAKLAYIMRGLPGSGKTTKAKELAGEIGAIHSTDDYFMVDGEYQFNPALLQQHHDANFNAFCDSLANGVPIVICDNTNVKRAYFERYTEAAEKAGYTVVTVTMPLLDPEVAFARSLHKTPQLLEAIKRFIREWEL